MQNNTCQFANHDNGKIISLCFDKKCEGRRVCCFKCLREFHKDHIDQLLEIDQIINFLRTESKKPVTTQPSPQVQQSVQELAQIQKYLEELQKLISSEIDRLTSSSLQQVCKTIDSRYHILEDKGQGLENQKLNQLAQDMLRDFEVQNCKIIVKESLITQQGQDFQKFLNQFSQTMTKIDNKLKQLNEIFQSKDKKINFQAFTEYQVLTGHTNIVFRIDICKQRNLLASGSQDKTVKLWNLENNALIKTYSYPGFVYDVVFSNQGNLLAFGGWGDHSVKLIDITNLEKDNFLIDLKGHTNCIRRLTFSNDSKYLISGSDDKTIRIWNISSKNQAFQLNIEAYATCVAISNEDILLATNSYCDGKLRIWNFQNHKLLCTHQAHTNGAGTQFSNDQKMLVSSGFDGTIKVWSLAELNQSKLSLIRGCKVATNCVRVVLFSPCSGFIITICNQNREIKVQDSVTGEIVKIFKSKATNNLYLQFINFLRNLVQVAISKDMDILAYGEDNNIVLWNKQGKNEIQINL